MQALWANITNNFLYNRIRQVWEILIFQLYKYTKECKDKVFKYIRFFFIYLA